MVIKSIDMVQLAQLHAKYSWACMDKLLGLSCCETILYMYTFDLSAAAFHFNTYVQVLTASSGPTDN